MTERKKLPLTRTGLTHHVEITTFDAPVEVIDIYITTGTYDNGALGELFLEGWRKEGIGAYDDWATASSILFQSGYEVDAWVTKFAFTRRAPAGRCKGDPLLPTCQSITDYVARWIGLHYGSDKCKAWIVGDKE